MNANKEKIRYQSDDVLLAEHIERGGIDTLLIDDDERLAILLGAHLALELDELTDLFSNFNFQKSCFNN